jgi:pimeloyl-ACP methyl ester carboxylesterase
MQFGNSLKHAYICAKPIIMSFITLNDRKIAYQLTGKGETVVLLHGFCEDKRIWMDVEEELHRYNFRTLSIDLPGFGNSDLLQQAHPSIEDYAADVYAVIQHIKLASCFLLGHSMGGYIALAIAEKYPVLIRGLGLLHSQPYPDTDEKKADRQKQIKFIVDNGHLLYIKQLIPKLFTPRFSSSNPFTLDTLIHRASGTNERGLIDALTAMIARPDRTAVLQKCSVPVLFIIGKDDTTIPTTASLAQILLPEISSIHLLDKVAHMAMLEASRQTQLIIRNFFVYCQQLSQTRNFS